MLDICFFLLALGDGGVQGVERIARGDECQENDPDERIDRAQKLTEDGGAAHKLIKITDILPQYRGNGERKEYPQ